MSLLFSPLRIRDVTTRNRLWVSPMCQYSAEDGLPGNWHFTHLTQFAIGGAGLIMTEATAVLPEGRISPRDTGLWNDDQRMSWSWIVDGIHDRGAKAGIQLSHAGRKASTWWPFAARSGSIPLDEGGWPTLSPSGVAYEGYAEPSEMSSAQIEEVVTAFREAARRAVEAGFDVIELHAAHGYLLHQFLSPLSNLRRDDWGGDLAGRARLLIRVTQAVRETIGISVALFVRVSGHDAAHGGLTIEDVSTVAGWARDAGADLFDVSSAGLVAHQSLDVSPGYQVPLSAAVRARTGVLTTAVGIITEGPQAERILRDGQADAIFAGREFLRDPHFALNAAESLGEDPLGIWPPQYLRAYRRARPRA